jgi:hypothetical protein
MRADEENAQMNRRRLKSSVTGFALVALLTTGPTYGAEPNIAEAARKEGKLVAYVSMLTENATSLLAEFKKKYPFIDTSLYRANTQKLLPKIQLEARTQQHEADIISATFTIWNELTRGQAGDEIRLTGAREVSGLLKRSRRLLEYFAPWRPGHCVQYEVSLSGDCAEEIRRFAAPPMATQEDCDGLSR